MDRLPSIVNRGLRDEFGSRTVQQAVSDERNDIMSAMRESVSSKVKELGISIVDIRIKSINLPKTVSDSVYDRMRAERARVAADLRARGAEEGEKLRATADREARSEEHTSELQSLMPNSYAVFCLKKKKTTI